MALSTKRHEAGRVPPEGKPLTIRVLDKWRGQGREEEVISGCFLNGSFLTDTGKTVPACLVGDWAVVNQQDAVEF